MYSLFFVDEWIILAAFTALLLIFAEIGFRFGHFQFARKGSSEGYLAHEASALGVLALLLGFTFSMAAQRFEARRDLILEEANAIGTAALRAQMLPKPNASQAHVLLVQYAESRVELFEARTDQALRASAVKKAELIQDKIWDIAREAVEMNRADIGASLFAQSVNGVIDIHDKRVVTATYHIPDAIYFLIYSVGACAFALSGVAAGVNRSRSRTSTFVMIMLVSAVVLFITDLDRPQRGLLTISDQSIRDELSSLQRQRPEP